MHAALGYGFVLRGNNEAASRHFEEAIRLGSQDFRVPYHLAKLAQGRQPARDEDRARILAWLERASRLRPDFPGTHVGLCRQYASEPKDPARAIQEGRAAMALEPQNLGYRAELGLAFLRLDMAAEAEAIGEQLSNLARSPQEQQVAASYGIVLTQYLERASRPTPGVTKPVQEPDPGPPPAPSSRSVPIKFSLPSYYAPLGREVLLLISDGKPETAIRKVEQARAAATNDYDRRVLQTLLDTLRGRRNPKAWASPAP